MAVPRAGHLLVDTRGGGIAAGGGEGRAAWFGSADYSTVAFDGTVLTVGIRGTGSSVRLLVQAAAEGHMPAIVDVLAKDPRNLTPELRRIWYVEAWALHAWLVDAAPEATRNRFAEWQSMMEKLPTNPREVDDMGLNTFLGFFKNDLVEMDRLFLEWVKGL